ncbi:MAG: hypothetical protein JWN56_817 [Sphingobacteriales bacterium]|nr:hypothetical protein [Sphingobacteriales bacterium]
MENQPSIMLKGCLLVLAILGWFALIGQFYINITSGIAPTSEIFIRYFSYFTILTNLLVAVCCTSIIMAPGSALGKFFQHAKTLTAITVYILIVGIIYNLILRFLWKPEGLQLFVDELLHSVIPTLFLLFWSLFVVKSQLGWKHVFPWLIYPSLYVIFIFIRGSFSGFYPYPFINVGSLGYEKALLNAMGIAIAFFVISLLFVAFAKVISKRTVHGQNNS